MSNDPKPGLIERLLMWVFEYEEIRDQPIGNQAGDLYLRRFFIWRDNKQAHNKTKKRLYLHKFYRGDKDRDLHDHPWSFVSLILKGGYYEETEHKQWNYMCDAPTFRILKWYGVGRILGRPATWAHKVVLPKGRTAWTLVLTGPKERAWGFHTKDGWCWWKNYLNGVCWCYDDPNESKQLTTTSA